MEIANINNDMMNFKKTDNILCDMKDIINIAQQQAHNAVNLALVQRNWLLGYRIAEEELNGSDRADYGASIILKMSKELTAEFGKGFTKTNLYSFYSFYKTYPNIFHTACGKSYPLLSWSHYRALIQVKDSKAREWYEQEAISQTWNVRTLQRNIYSQYYYRLLQSQKKELVEKEMKKLTKEFQDDKLEFIKNPVVAEFLGLTPNEQLFASMYQLYLPTKEELKAEIETQKTMFYLQHKEQEEQADKKD